MFILLYLHLLYSYNRDPESKQILCLVLVVLHFQYVNEKSDTQFQNDM